MSIDESEKSQLVEWIEKSRDGDSSALNHLAKYLLPKALEFASRQMRSLSPVDDYEDIAISAVQSICASFREGRGEFLGVKRLDGLLQRYVIGTMQNRQRYHLADKRDVQLNAEFDSDLHKPRNGGPTAVRFDWLDEQSKTLSPSDQMYLEDVLNGLGNDVRGLFSELAKRLDDMPRKVLLLITTRSITNDELAVELDCAPSSIERYRKTIRRKLRQLINE